MQKRGRTSLCTHIYSHKKVGTRVNAVWTMHVTDSFLLKAILVFNYLVLTVLMALLRPCPIQPVFWNSWKYNYTQFNCKWMRWKCEKIRAGVSSPRTQAFVYIFSQGMCRRIAKAMSRFHLTWTMPKYHQTRVRDSKDFKRHIKVLSEDTAIFPICPWNIPIENATAHPFRVPVCVTLFASFHSQTSNTIRPSSSIATWAKEVLLIRWPYIQIPLFLLPATSSAYFTSFPADKSSFASLRIQPDIWQAHLENIGNIINFLEASLGECWWFPVQWL